MSFAKGDSVVVDWFDGRGAVDPATVVRSKGGALVLRFPGEAKARTFTVLSQPAGVYQSQKGSTVEIVPA